MTAPERAPTSSVPSDLAATSQSRDPLPSGQAWRVAVADGAWARGRVRHLVANHADTVTAVPLPTGADAAAGHAPTFEPHGLDLVVVEVPGGRADVDAVSASLPPHAGPSLLVVKGVPERPYRNVIVGTDLTTRSTHLADVAARLAPDAQQTAIHAVGAAAAADNSALRDAPCDVLIVPGRSRRRSR